MKVSLVIPVYNEEKYIKACLSSVFNQEIKPDEVIVVDNNCTDKTIQLAKKFPVTIIHEKKQSLIFARNKGFNQAKYEIIARCDADTILPPNWIKKIKNAFKNNQLAGLTGPVSFYDIPFQSTIYSKIYILLMRFLLKNNVLIGPNMIITKSIWKKVRNQVCLDDKKVHEDIDLAIHISKAGGKIVYDHFLIVKSSGRRIFSNPFSFFLEYPVRAVRNLLSHI